MLKVVGASWVQTRITLFTLAGVTFVGILTYYYGGHPLPLHDGNYAATAFWSRTTGKYRLQFWGQNNDPKVVREGVARAYYRPNMINDGWASMEIESQGHFPDHVQAHAAGLLEGSLSWQLIYYHWKNTIERTCEDRQDFCDQARIILDQNTENIRDQARALDHVDPFWHQVNLFYEQLDGLEVGWRYAVRQSRKDFDIPHEDFLWMNMACDLRDLELMYNASLEANPDRPSLSMALLKLVSNDDSNQFLLAHASSSFYSAMLRVQKRYILGLHMTGASDAAPVAGRVVTFTSYPGTIHSQDDFYQVSAAGSSSPFLTVSGTSIKNLNQELWARAQVTTQVLMGPRVMAANRLAVNGSQWARLVAESYSGTGNKQWLVVQPGGGRVNLWVVEQLPGVTHTEVQTARLAEQGYWASYGVPHYKNILELSGMSEAVKESARRVAEALSAGQTEVTDLESLVCLMRSPDLTLAGRSDLSIEEVEQLKLRYLTKPSLDTQQGQGSAPRFQHNLKEVLGTRNTIKQLNQELHRMEDEASDTTTEDLAEELPTVDLLVNKRKTSDTDEKILPLREFSGVIDLKVSKKEGYLAAAGPPFSVTHGAVVVEPFQWSKSPIKDLPHVGQADVWNFDPVEPKWVWN